MSGHRGILAVLSGPSGVGKSSIIAGLLGESRFVLSVSATTRAPRPGEKDGVAYHFLDEARFQRLVDEGAFLEHAVVHGKHRYGTLAAEVRRAVDAGSIVLLDIDVQGTRQLRAGGIACIRLFIAPPDFAALEERLHKRGTEDDVAISRRLETARDEMRATTEYDRVVVNDDLIKTTTTVREILLDAAARSTGVGDGARTER